MSPGFRVVAIIAMRRLRPRWPGFLIVVALSALCVHLAALPVDTIGSRFGGIPTTLPWGVDLGDGISRHPVEIYESLAMAAFLGFYWNALVRKRAWATAHGFHYFALAYAAQRFAWEFLKPYTKIIGPLNVFHLLMIGLAIYASLWIAAGRTATGHSA